MKTDVETFARSYIDAALESQRQFGERVELSTEDYEGAVEGARAAFEALLRLSQHSNGHRDNGSPPKRSTNGAEK